MTSQTRRQPRVSRGSRVSRVSRGSRGFRGSRRKVINGNAESTPGGLSKKNLSRNKRGAIVSKKKRILGKKNLWAKASKAARKELKITGFVKFSKPAVGKVESKFSQGEKLYVLTKEKHEALKK